MAELDRPSEQRDCVRQRMTLPILVEDASEDSATPIRGEGKTRDVSSRGAFFQAKGEFKVGQRLRLTMEVPPDLDRRYSLRINWEAEVVRIEPGKPGDESLGVAVRVLHTQPPYVYYGSEKRPN